MLASDLSPMAMVFVAVCGGSAPDPGTVPTSTGLTCNEYNLMIKVEFILGRECDFDEDCDQIIEVEDTCPTADRVLNADFDTDYLQMLIDEAESVGCTVVYPGDRGDCDPESLPVCDVGTCTWM